MKQFLLYPWPWWFSGFVIGLVMLTLVYFGKTFSCSSNFRTICAATGLGKRSTNFFKFDWKKQIWNLVFMLGAMAGGYIAHHYLSNGKPLKISRATADDLARLRMLRPTSIQPPEIFGIDAVTTPKGFLILAVGGLLIGFGSRYAGGCTSGHAITGLSNMQSPSLLAVIGFFIGGLIMTFFILPLLF